MEIGFFEIRDWEKKYLKTKLKNHSLSFYSEPLTKQNINLVKNLDVISTFIYSKLNKDVISHLKKTKLIATRSTGFDHIDVNECEKRKILVCNVPFYGENTVAEHTFALILSISRNIHKSYMRTIKGNYSIEGLKGFDLKGKTLGVIGAGHIGLHVIRMAKAFGMNTLAFDVNKDHFIAEVLGFNYVPLTELLSKSDIITLHVPENKKTHHLINEQSINQMKKGVIIINTSRGGVIDIEALSEALEKKKVAGVGLDVIEGEELIKEEKQLIYDQKKVDVLGQLVKDHILLSRDNVVFTPHIGFYSQEALIRIIDTTILNINNFVLGKQINLVN